MNEVSMKFSVDQISIENIQEISDSQFMKGRMKAFADGVNANGYLFPLDGIKKAAKTILGKPVLAAFTFWNKDGLGGHDKEEFPVGYIPEDSKIMFEESEDGRTFLCVDFYIWKNYTNGIEDILLKSNGKKQVSVELKAINPIDDEETGLTIVNDFVFAGVTILSDSLNPAIKDASLEVLKFSTEEFEKEKDIFDKLRKTLQLNNSAMKELDCSFSSKNKNKEEAMQEQLNEEVVPEEVSNACGDKVDNACGEDKVENACGDKVDNAEEQSTEPEEQPVENACGDKVENAEEEKVEESVENAKELEVKCSELEEKNSTLEVKCSEYETTISDLKSQLEALTIKCSTLEEFKTNTENAQKVQAIECALAEVTDILNAQEIAEWREKSVNCSSVDGFKNELKAFAFDLQKQRGKSTSSDSLRNAIPVYNSNQDESVDIWDRLQKSL